MTSQFECKVERKGSVMIVKPCGQLDSGETDRFEAVLLETLEKDKPRIIIDLEGLMFVSSSGVARAAAGRQADTGEEGDAPRLQPATPDPQPAQDGRLPPAAQDPAVARRSPRRGDGRRTTDGLTARATKRPRRASASPPRMHAASSSGSDRPRRKSAYVPRRSCCQACPPPIGGSQEVIEHPPADAGQELRARVRQTQAANIAVQDRVHRLHHASLHSWKGRGKPPVAVWTRGLRNRRVRKPQQGPAARTPVRWRDPQERVVPQFDFGQTGHVQPTDPRSRNSSSGIDP